ncbi:hypothetical protein BST92_09760 [Nonlabens arenilitoris]|uniref:SGNH/GDSL hydrolase family protein n=1 Tax=Nonlabens arenilitoris TaxID=1217969 RepID=A0A2S7UD43_9FLAO|nr:hypothetical protein [Nonlabens arenilitoris]PQJ32193.1 hypothetical protein BST92_09760 [Nonlabens arenilitoris]
MTRFLNHTLFIILTLVVTALVIDKVYTRAFNTSNPRNKVQFISQLRNTHIDYIFLGSSRVENHIDCEVVSRITGKSCINLGLQGSKTNDSAVFLQMLNNNNVSYKKVLFQLDYAVNFDAYSPQFKSFITPYLNTESVSDNIIIDLNNPFMYRLPFVRYAANDKLSGFREVILQLFDKPSRIDLSNGFEGKQGIGRDIKGNLPATAKASNRGVLWMKKLENNNLIFYTAPYCSQATNRDIFNKDLIAKYPEVISYIDIFDNTPQYYSDCGHLNITGAREFTAILTEDLLID